MLKIYALLTAIAITITFLYYSSFNNNCCFAQSELKKISDKYEAIFFDAHNIPTQSLTNLLALTKVSCDHTPAAIVHATQKKWLRAAGSERWEIPYKAAEQALLEILRSIGFIDEIKPHENWYDGAIIFGATAHTMRLRLAHLVYLYENYGVRFKKIIFLVGERPRNTTVESDDVLLSTAVLPFNSEWHFNNNFPTTETEMARMIYEQSLLPWKEVPVTFVDTPLQINSEGAMRRPTTEDTIRVFRDYHHPVGKFIAVSSQPHVHRQGYILHCNLAPQCYVEVVGAAIDQSALSVGLLLDSVAMSLYEVYQRRFLKRND